jgi:hypothetical protein
MRREPNGEKITTAENKRNPNKPSRLSFQMPSMGSRKQREAKTPATAPVAIATIISIVPK